MIRTGSALLALLCLCTPVFAQESEDKLTPLIDGVVAAYGGDALISLRNYEIEESYISPNTGQSWSPTLTDIGKINQRFVHDLESGNVYFENWFMGRGGVFPGVTIVNGDNAWAVNLIAERYGDAASPDPYVIAGGTMRTTDTLLARELHKSRDAAEYLGEAVWMNRNHELVKIPFPSSPDLTLYVDAETSLINRMTRENPQLGLLDYVFEQHEFKNGISRAQQVNFSVGGVPNLMGAAREIRFNQRLSASVFELPEGLSPEGERLDGAELAVNRLARNVYHIGQNAGYSIFVDTGREIIGCGGYPGLSQRLERFREETGSHRPLRYQVVTHHHQDHLGGVDEALGLGATLVTVADTVPVIQAASQLSPESGRFLNVNSRMTLGEGNDRVELYDVSTIHSASNLLFYVPGTRTLFIADHFGGPYAEGVPTANRNTVSMAEALEPLDLDFRKLVTAHGARVYTNGDFEASVKSYRDYDCPDNLPLCSR
jgi:glyoxylase-like metal-dependent hydrolase (beta-lactamase superfamily II)